VRLQTEDHRALPAVLVVLLARLARFGRSTRSTFHGEVLSGGWGHSPMGVRQGHLERPRVVSVPVSPSIKSSPSFWLAAHSPSPKLL